MYKINFDKLTVRNFMSIGDYPIEWDIVKNKKTLIQGKNFSGKTSLFNALTFSLFGRAYSKIKKTALINTINNKDCVVTLTFNIQDNQFKIIRGIKPDTFEIYKNDVLIPQPPTVKDYQNLLEKEILKMDFQSYTQLVMLGTSGYTPFLQLSAQDRRSFVESFLGIEIFTDLNKVAKKKMQDISNEIFTLETNISATNKTISILESVIETTNNVKDTRIAEINSRLTEHVKTYKDMQDDIQSTKEKIESYPITESEVEEKKKYIGKINQYIAVRQSEMDNNAKIIQKIDSNSICPECNQEVSIDHKNKHKEEYVSNNRTLYDQITKSKQILSQEEIALQQIQEQLKIKNNLSQELAMKEYKANSLKQEMTKLYNERESLKKPETTDNTEKLATEKKQLSDYEELLSDKANTKKHLDVILTSLKDSGAKAQIIKNYIPIIVERTNKYLSKLNMFLKFGLDEEFNEVLKSRHRDEFQFESFSMGERMRINIALLFAWRDVAKIKTGVETNVILIDEIFEIGDTESFEEFLGLISLQDDLNCVIISHKSGIEQMFDSVMNVKRVKGFTKIEINN